MIAETRKGERRDDNERRQEKPSARIEKQGKNRRLGEQRNPDNDPRTSVDDPIANFWGQGKDLMEVSKFHAAVQVLLREIRPTLKPSSKTAKLIDAKAPWREIAGQAEEEGLNDLAEILQMMED